jgi:hypothetical protein
VGLKVATGLLARAFFETYGIPLADVLGKKRQRPTLGGYEFSVRRFLPRIAYAETVLHRRRMPDDVNDADFQALQGALKQADFENGWEQYRRKAGIGTYMLAGLIYVLPPIGPLALLRIKGPDSATEQEYVKSVDASIASIRRVLGDVSNDAGNVAADLPNRDLDTGLKTAPGTYRLTDETYAQLLGRLTQGGDRKIPSGLKDDVRQFYADPSARNATKKDAKRWAGVQRELGVLDQLRTVPEP